MGILDPKPISAAAIAAQVANPASVIGSQLTATILDRSTQKTSDLRNGRARSLVPSFTKPLTAPVMDGGATPILWPSVIRMDGILSTPLDKFYMYYSTDHSETGGGIYLRTAPAISGPYTDRGIVYTDTAGGTQTETPDVVWVPETGLFHMYYQQKLVPGYAGQVTQLATSTDGITWTRVGVVLGTVTLGNELGSGAMTYTRTHRIGSKWVAYHIYGDGDRFNHGISHSKDGITWVTDRKQLGNGAEFSDAIGERGISWNSGIAEWQGVRYWIGIVGAFVSGTTPGDSRLGIAPLAPDMRHLLAPPKFILNVSQGWETTNLRAVNVLVDDNEIHIFYQMDNKVGYATTKGA